MFAAVEQMAIGEQFAVSAICASTNGVSTYPGPIALTVMPWAPSSVAIDRVMPMTAPLEAT